MKPPETAHPWTRPPAEIDAPSCAADLTSDAKNCGRCGHDCAGGACDGGRCQPVTLTSSEADLEELRLAGDQLLFRSDLHVQSIGLDGGLPNLMVSCSDRFGLVVVDGGFYSWCSTSLTLRDVVDAGILASSVIDGFSGVSSSGWVIFLAGNQRLDRVPATLGDAGYSQVTSSATGFRAAAVNSSQVFFMTLDGTLSYAAAGSGSGTELARDQTAPSAIAVDDTAVFWAAGSDTDQAVLRTRPLSLGGPTTIATGLDHPYNLALDATHVYMTLRGPPPNTNGSIVRVPRAGGDVEHLADGVLNAGELVVTDEFVVWAAQGINTEAGYRDGAIYRLAK
jgi:hypothetical protein